MPTAMPATTGVLTGGTIRKQAYERDPNKVKPMPPVLTVGTVWNVIY
jgi:hypothetical protein